MGEPVYDHLDSSSNHKAGNERPHRHNESVRHYHQYSSILSNQSFSNLNKVEYISNL